MHEFRSFEFAPYFPIFPPPQMAHFSMFGFAPPPLIEQQMIQGCWENFEL